MNQMRDMLIRSCVAFAFGVFNAITKANKVAKQVTLIEDAMARERDAKPKLVPFRVNDVPIVPTFLRLHMPTSTSLMCSR
jgi:hypothetical protein